MNSATPPGGSRGRRPSRIFGNFSETGWATAASTHHHLRRHGCTVTASMPRRFITITIITIKFTGFVDFFFHPPTKLYGNSSNIPTVKIFFGLRVPRRKSYIIPAPCTPDDRISRIFHAGQSGKINKITLQTGVDRVLIIMRV